MHKETKVISLEERAKDEVKSYLEVTQMPLQDTER
jgi:hypothetical protein